MIAAIGLVDTGTSLFSNSSQLNNDELEAIKDILTDRQSANYKDLENQTAINNLSIKHPWALGIENENV